MNKFAEIGKRIRASRHHLTQPEFAKKIGISLPALQNYESGKRIPRGDVLRKIADYAKTLVDWILRGEDGEITRKQAERAVLQASYAEGEEKPTGDELERQIDFYIKEYTATQLKVAEMAAIYSKPRIKEITTMLEDMDKKDVEEVFRLVRDKKQAAAWRHEKKPKEG